MSSDTIDRRLGVTYANHDGVALAGDLYMPEGAGPFPALVAVHGGGWVQGVRTAFQYWGPYLAVRGYVLFAISYRLAKKGQKTFPQAVQDVLAGIQFVRGSAAELKVDPERIGVFGISAGAHLGSLATLSGTAFAGGYPQDKFASVSAKAKAFVGIYGIYDVKEMYHKYNAQTPIENNIQHFLGTTPMENPRLYFEASSISYATVANNQTGVYLAVGTEDDLVNRAPQTDAFQLALKQAGFFVRTCILPGAPHYWGNDPIEEPNSYSGFLAPRLVRFLQERL
jgi:acetyl esterase/lipase